MSRQEAGPLFGDDDNEGAAPLILGGGDPCISFVEACKCPVHSSTEDLLTSDNVHAYLEMLVSRSLPALHIRVPCITCSTKIFCSRAPPRATSAAAMASSILTKPHRFILVSDLDWTMADHDDKEHKALNAFNDLWRSKFAHDSLLVFSTGRSHALYTQLREEVPLGTPDVLVCSVGTEIFFEASGAAPEPDRKWVAELDKGWDRGAAIRCAESLSQLRMQSESEQRPHKLSYHLSAKGAEGEAVVNQLEEKLAAAGVSAKVIHSGGMDVDILPKGASKGDGLKFLLREIEEAGTAPKDGVMVCGDSGNDIELFAVPGVRGCMVVNAHPELRAWCDAHPSPSLFQASKRCAGGIVEALEHFKLVPQQ